MSSATMRGSGRTTRARARKLRRIWNLDRLPMPRCFMHGPKWRKLFEVIEQSIAEIDPLAARYHRPGKKLLTFSFESEVRERLFEEIRPGVFAD